MESTRHDANNRLASENIREQIVRMLRCARYAGPTAGLAMGVLCPAALGAPGDLDPTFADVGRFIFPSDTSGAVWSIETQADDILVEGGGWYRRDYYHDMG